MSTGVDDIELGIRIGRARQDRRWTQTQLAQLLGLTQGQVSRIEKGSRRLSSVELALIADAFGMPVSDFLDLHPLPVFSAIAARSAEGADLTALLQQAEGLARIGRVLASVSHGLPENNLKLILPTRGREIDKGAVLASRVREAIGVPSAPLSTAQLLDLAESRTGLSVWIQPFDGNGDGVYLQDEVGAFAVVNSSKRPEARVRFTLAHELGHHLFGDGIAGILRDASVDKADGLVEKRANAFAANLLLPVSALPDHADADTVQSLAAKFGVAPSTASWQLTNNGCSLPERRPSGAGRSDPQPLTWRSPILLQTAVEAFASAAIGSAPVEYLLGRALTDHEYDTGVSIDLPAR